MTYHTFICKLFCALRPEGQMAVVGGSPALSRIRRFPHLRRRQWAKQQFQLCAGIQKSET